MKNIYDFDSYVERLIRELQKKYFCILCFKVNETTNEWFMSVFYHDGSNPIFDNPLGVASDKYRLMSYIRKWFKENT